MEGSERLGGAEPRYRFALVPGAHRRGASPCPACGGKTRQRKEPLVIAFPTEPTTVIPPEPASLIPPEPAILLNKVCRYCPGCDLLMAFREEIERVLVLLWFQRDPAVMGSPFAVLGTMDRADWRRGRKEPLSAAEMLERLHDFREVLTFPLGERRPCWGLMEAGGHAEA